jgi:hypothetical protein
MFHAVKTRSTVNRAKRARRGIAERRTIDRPDLMDNWCFMGEGEWNRKASVQGTDRGSG